MSTFTRKDEWSGGHYELCVRGFQALDVQIVRAISRATGISHWYGRRDVEVDFQEPLVLENLEYDNCGSHLHSVLRLPKGEVSCGFGSYLHEGSSTYFARFFVPMGALYSAYPVGGYPFGQADSSQWRMEIDEVFKRIGEEVFVVAPFDMGLIGGEVDVTHDIDLAEVPEERWLGFLRNEGGSLRWYPPTTYQPSFG